MPNDVHYIERDTGSGAAVWAVVAVLIVLLALIFFGSNVFRGEVGGGDYSDINIRGTIEQPGGTSGTQ